ncbi:hypothetical protein QTL95_17355 [Rhizobium sp. S152]|uniref:hypothetical protein n=1 Tax=Rhizobium sp. S152 TaxID=3055038 RepID=UPI0025A9F6C2|nr:hypothetical protein [Rhizobium sp. S152]MDM9627670.1 hypothetical protein [Rhizobium sp. S152]
MSDIFRRFEEIARRSANVGENPTLAVGKALHPFDDRKIHPEIGNDFGVFLDFRMIDHGNLLHFGCGAAEPLTIFVPPARR